MTKRLVALWTAVVGVLVLGVASTIASAQSSPAIDTSDWATYRDDAMGFEVRHPRGWPVRLTTGTLVSVLLGPSPQAGASRTSLQFFVQRNINPRGLAIDQWYTDQLRGSTATPPPATTVIGRRPAMQREWTGTLGRHVDFFVSLNATDVFQIAINDPPSHGALDPTSEAVLATVRFLP